MHHSSSPKTAAVATLLLVLVIAVIPGVWAQEEDEGVPAVDIAATMEAVEGELAQAPMGYECVLDDEGTLVATHGDLPTLVALVNGNTLFTVSLIAAPEDTDDEGLLVICNDLNRDARLARYFVDAGEDGETHIIAGFGTHINDELDSMTYGTNLWEFVKEVMAAAETVANAAKG
jgi:rhodanese-related sulfurtransferase